MGSQLLRVGVWGYAIVCALFASSALAQLAPSADPSRIQNRITAPTVEFNNLEKNQSIDQNQSMPYTIPQGTEAIRLTIQAIDIQGMTAYTPEEVKPLYADLIGKEVKLTALYQVAALLQKKYHDDSYTLTKVIFIPQTINKGHAILQVIEGYASEVELDPTLRDNAVLDDIAARIRAMRPLNTSTLERLMLIVNDLPDMKMSAILATPKEGVDTPGAIRVILKKVDFSEPLGKITADNYGSRFTGPWQAQATAHLYHLGADASDLSLSLASAVPWREQHFVTTAYRLPLFGASGANLSLSGIWAETEPGDSLKPLEIKGNTQIYSIMLSYPIIRQRAKTWNIDGALEWKEGQTDLLGGTLFKDSMRILSLGTSYSFTDSWRGFNALDLHASKGFGIWGASDKNDTLLSRADGDPEFEKLEFFVGRVQALPADLELYGLVSGQYAFNPLLSAEEFGFGGQLGRGFDPSQIAGDRGLAATIEVRYNSSLNALDSDVKLQPYLFYDAGKVWNIDSGASDSGAASATGFGARITIENQLDANFLAAIPVNKPTNGGVGNTTQDGTRIIFSLSRSF